MFAALSWLPKKDAKEMPKKKALLFSFLAAHSIDEAVRAWIQWENLFFNKFHALWRDEENKKIAQIYSDAL